MEFCKVFWSILEGMKCLPILVAIILYRVILFLIFLSASVGLATLTCYLYLYVTGRDTYPEVQPCLTMTFLSIWAGYSLGMESRFSGHILDQLKQQFPGIMSCGRFAVHLGLFVVAFTAVYLEFENANTVQEFHRSPLGIMLAFGETFTSEKKKVSAVEDEPWHVTVFLFALAYLVFVTSRNLQKDMYLVVRNLPSVTFSVFNNWLLRISFAIIHVFVNLIYFIPCLIIVYATTTHRTSGLVLYFQTNFIAAMVGMVVALLELNRPWPQIRARMPFVFYENNEFGKKLLARVLVIGIILMFYRPKNRAKTLQSKFDSTNNDVINFCLMVAFTTLHLVKFGVHSVLALANEYDRRMNEINNLVFDAPEFVGSRVSLQSGHHAHGTSEERGICIENAIINSHSHDDQNANLDWKTSANTSDKNVLGHKDHCTELVAHTNVEDSERASQNQNVGETGDAISSLPNTKTVNSGTMTTNTATADAEGSHLEMGEKDSSGS